MSRIMVALGGNALQTNGAVSAGEQEEVARITASRLVDLAADGHDLIIGHGNGPQVGALLLHEEAGSTKEAPAMPLEVDGAMSQGEIGYWLQQAIGNELCDRTIDKDIVTIVTQTVVASDDPAFSNPSKPIGPFYSEQQAKDLATKRGWIVKADAGRGWRRVVASPRPVDIVEKRIIKGLVDQGTLVIAAGGGGVPVIKRGNRFVGMDAVIDKDFAAALLGKMVEASVLLILTAVDSVTVGYRTDHELPLDNVTVDELKGYIEANEFAPGSMLPKVQAAIDFVNFRSENVAIITSIDKAEAAIQGKAGTLIHC